MTKKVLTSIDLTGNKTVNQADPTSAQDGATKNYTDKIRPFSVTVARSGIADYVCDGIADDVQIQAAIDAVNAAGGGVVFARANTNPYRISATVTLPENVSIIGERLARQAAGGVTFKTSASFSPTSLFTMTGTTNPSANSDLKHDVVIENITFDGNSTTTNAFMLTNQDTIKFINCRFISSTNAINTTWDSTVAPTAGTIPGGIYLERCNVSTISTGIGITLNYQTQCWVNNCWFTAGSGTPTAWIKFNASNKVKVTNSEFNTATTAFLFTDVNSGGGLDFPAHNIVISGSVFATGGTVIDDNRTHTNSDYVMISGTMASGTTMGDTLVGTHNTVVLTDGIRTGTGTFTGDVTVPDEAYGGGWNGSTEVPTKNAVYDKIEAISVGDTNWGDIGGTLSDQTDLQAALDDKADVLDTVYIETASTTYTALKSDTAITIGAADVTVTLPTPDESWAHHTMVVNNAYGDINHVDSGSNYDMPANSSRIFWVIESAPSTYTWDTTPVLSSITTESQGGGQTIYSYPGDNHIIFKTLEGLGETEVFDSGTDGLKVSTPRKAYNVKESQFGATGDGTTDDTAAIQAAIDAANAAGGAIVFVPPGTYVIDPATGLNLYTASHLMGAGMYSTTFKVKDATDAIGNIIKAEGISSITVSDFSIDGNKATLSTDKEVSTNYGLYLGNAAESRIERVRTFSLTGVGIHVYNSRAVIVTGCNSAANDYHGYEFEQVTDSVLQGNDGHGNFRHGVFVSPGEVGGTGAVGNLIDGNALYDNEQYGVAFGIDAGGLSIGLTHNNIVSNNLIRNNGDYGISLYRVDDTQILGNLIEGSGKIGLYIYRSHNNIIEGNRFVRNSADGDGLYDEILLEGATDGEGSFYNMIVNNFFQIDSGDGSTIPRANYAIREADAGDGSNIIKNNYIPWPGATGRVQILNANTTYELVGDSVDNRMSLRTFDKGVAIAPDATLPGSTMGLDAPFGTAALRFFNDNSGGNLQFVAPHGTADWFLGGNNTLSATDSYVTTHGYPIKDVDDPTDPQDAATKAYADTKQTSDADLTAIAGLSPSNDDVIQRKSGAWTNRTPAQLKTDLSLTKTDVGLGNVDNTSDATKNSAAVTLTNKTLTSPVINTPTGIVKGDVGLGNVDNTSDATKNSAIATLTNKDLSSGTNTFPTLNQNTTGSAAKWTTARNLAGNSVDGSAAVPFANKFIVQGTTDTGLTGAQFLGALATGLVKNTTTTGVLSVATAGTDYYAPGSTDVAIADGGTGASTKAAAFDALSPMTTSGDIVYGGTSGTGTRLAKGSDGNVLTLASGLPTWAPGGSGDMVLASTQTVSGAKTFNAGTIRDKGSIVFDVKAFGAVGNDSTDDTSAIQSAIDAANTAGGGTVWFPKGTYKLSAALKLYSGTTPTITAYSNLTLAGAGASGTNGAILKQYTTGADVIKGLNDVANGAQSLNITIQDICLAWGTATLTNSGNGLYLAQQGAGGPSYQQFHLKNVTATNFQGSGKYGFNIESMIVSTIETCMAVSCANGFYLNGASGGAYNSVSTSVTFLNCYANMATNGQIGYNILDNTYISFVGCACDIGANNSASAYLVDGSNCVTFQGCGVELNGTATLANGVKIQGGSSQVSLHGSYFYQSKTMVDVYVTGSSTGVTIIGAQDNSSVSGSTGLKIDGGSQATEIDCNWGGVATLRTLATTAVWQTPGIKRRQTQTSSATPSINVGTTDIHTLTAQAAAITSFTTNLTGTPVDGQTLWISILDNGTARAITWGASFESSTAATLPTTTVISTRMDIGFIWNAATSKWRCVAVA